MSAFPLSKCVRGHACEVCYCAYGESIHVVRAYFGAGFLCRLCLIMLPRRIVDLMSNNNF